MSDATLKDRIGHIIQEERQALLNGDFDKIAELMEEKRELATDLETQTFPLEELAPIKDGLHRNQELFDQALAGIRNVAERIVELRQIRRSMNTYDARGQKHVIDAPIDRKLEKRA